MVTKSDTKPALRGAAIKGERARSDEDKGLRRAAILDAALAAWDRLGFAAITMTDLARETGLAKGTLYLYFRTKEEVFLGALEGLLWTWFDDVDALLARFDGDADDLARALVGSLAGRERMVRLLAILNAVLEQNVEDATGLAFKTALLARLARTGAALEARLPALASGQGARLLLHFNALVIGMHQVTSPTPALRAAAGDPALAPLVLDFERELTFALSALLRGVAPGSAPHS